MPEALQFDAFAQFVRAFFGASDIELNRGSVADDVAGWDSLGHARLIMAVEQHYRIRLPAEQLFDIDDLGMMFDLVAVALGSQASRA